MKTKFLFGKDWEIIKDVTLNRGGKVIGHVLKSGKKKIYYTKRLAHHFFKKYQGFGIQKAIIPVIWKDFNVTTIIIDYQGAERHIYRSHIADWLETETTVDHVKEGETLESYGQQKVLGVNKMEEI